MGETLRVFVGPRRPKHRPRLPVHEYCYSGPSLGRSPVEIKGFPPTPTRASVRESLSPGGKPNRKSPASRTLFASSASLCLSLALSSRPLFLGPVSNLVPAFLGFGVYPMLIVFKGVAACLNHSSLFKVNYLSPSASSLVGQSLSRQRPSQGPLCSRGISHGVFSSPVAATRTRLWVAPLPRPKSPPFSPDVAVRLRAI